MLFPIRAIVEELATLLSAQYPEMAFVKIGNPTLLPDPSDPSLPSECIIIEAGRIEGGPSAYGVSKYSCPLTIFYCRQTTLDEPARIMMEKATDIGNKLCDWSGLPGFSAENVVKIEGGWPTTVDFGSEPEKAYRATSASLSVVAISQKLVVTTRETTL